MRTRSTMRDRVKRMLFVSAIVFVLNMLLSSTFVQADQDDTMDHMNGTKAKELAEISTGMDLPWEYKELLSKTIVSAGDENLAMEGSQYAFHDLNADGTPELLVRYPMAGTRDGLSDIYVFVMIEGQPAYAGSLAYTGALEFAGYSSKGYYFEEVHNDEHTLFSWNIYEISDGSLKPVSTMRIEINPTNVSLTSFCINDQPVSLEEFNNTFAAYLDGTMAAGEDGVVSWNGYRPITFTDNTFVGEEITAPSDAPPAVSSTATELTGLLGMDMNEVSSQYGLENYYEWYAYCDEFTVHSSPVAAISLHNNDQYTLSGVHPLMDIETARKILLDAGYEITRTEDVYVLKPENYYIDLNGMKLSDKEVMIFKLDMPDAGDKTDLTSFLGKDFSEVQKEFPGLVLNDYGEYSNGEVGFKTDDDNTISFIKISGDESAYCIDGFTPSAGPHEYGLPYILMLGSGEWYDPLHGVIFRQPAYEDESGNTVPAYIEYADHSIFPSPEDEFYDENDDSDYNYAEDTDLFSYSDEYVSFEVPEGGNNIELQNSEYGLAYVLRFADVDGDIAYRRSRADVVRIDKDLLEGVAQQGMDYPGYETLFKTSIGGYEEYYDVYDVECINQDGEYEFVVSYTALSAGDLDIRDHYRFIGYDPSTGFCMQVYSRNWRDNTDSESDYDESQDQFKAFFRTFRLNTSIDHYDMEKSLPIPKMLYADYSYVIEDGEQGFYLYAARIGNAFLKNQISAEEAVSELEDVKERVPDHGTEVYGTIYQLIDSIQNNQPESIRIIVDNIIVMTSLDASDVYDFDWSTHGPDDDPTNTGINQAENDADWDAVHEASLVAGDPVTVPGDFYADGQERYKETGYILPQSATKYLTEEDIAHLSMKGCCYARNEIYARHDRQFNAVELQDYFNSRSWYTALVAPEEFSDDYAKSVFNEYEFYNANFLWKYETDHGMYWPQ